MVQQGKKLVLSLQWLGLLLWPGFDPFMGSQEDLGTSTCHGTGTAGKRKKKYIKGHRQHKEPRDLKLRRRNCTGTFLSRVK